MNKIFSKIKDESGQALVIVAASIVLLFGVTAFSVDLGMAYNAKAELQAAADAAALAGAQDLPNAALAIETAKSYAGFNEVQVSNVQAVSPYAGDSKLIEVTCSMDFQYLFARVIGFDSKTITARAVAIKEASWAGDALPFVNLDDTVATAGQSLVLWEKTTAAGDDEKLWPRDADVDAEYKIYNNDGVYSSVLLDSVGNHGWDGFALKSGIDNNDLKEIEPLIKQYVGQSVYVLSLMPEYIPASEKTNYNNKQIIPIEHLVLLKCTVVKYDFGSNNGTHGITLTYSGTSYTFAQIIAGEVPDLSPDGSPRVKLVE